jgi:hypothetical protein
MLGAYLHGEFMVLSDSSVDKITEPKSANSIIDIKQNHPPKSSNKIIHQNHPPKSLTFSYGFFLENKSQNHQTKPNYKPSATAFSWRTRINASMRRIWASNSPRLWTMTSPPKAHSPSSKLGLCGL